MAPTLGFVEGAGGSASSIYLMVKLFPSLVKMKPEDS